jgi:hypothetical protein
MGCRTCFEAGSPEIRLNPCAAPEGDTTEIRPFDNENMLVNMSIWRDAAALSAYVYRSCRPRRPGGGFTTCDGHDPEGNLVQFRESGS